MKTAVLLGILATIGCSEADTQRLRVPSPADPIERAEWLIAHAPRPPELQFRDRGVLQEVPPDPHLRWHRICALLPPPAPPDHGLAISDRDLVLVHAFVFENDRYVDEYARRFVAETELSYALHRAVANGSMLFVVYANDAQKLSELAAHFSEEE